MISSDYGFSGEAGIDPLAQMVEAIGAPNLGGIAIDGGRSQGVATKKLHMQTCDVCGTETKSSHCKVACPNCGYRMDCSDITLNPDDDGGADE